MWVYTVPQAGGDTVVWIWCPTSYLLYTLFDYRYFTASPDHVVCLYTPPTQSELNSWSVTRKKPHLEQGWEGVSTGSMCQVKFQLVELLQLVVVFSAGAKITRANTYRNYFSRFRFAIELFLGHFFLLYISLWHISDLLIKIRMCSKFTLNS